MVPPCLRRPFRLGHMAGRSPSGRLGRLADLGRAFRHIRNGDSNAGDNGLGRAGTFRRMGAVLCGGHHGAGRLRALFRAPRQTARPPEELGQLLRSGKDVHERQSRSAVPLRRRRQCQGRRERRPCPWHPRSPLPSWAGGQGRAGWWRFPLHLLHRRRLFAGGASASAFVPSLPSASVAGRGRERRAWKPRRVAGRRNAWRQKTRDNGSGCRYSLSSVGLSPGVVPAGMRPGRSNP